ncbi:hypothetical protein [Azospirillum doebereinerae]|uniref:Uncharacterized protein n=1 Tax=Azospirillum doebereinerae TaxID=92933 RepID=A0A3S0XLZ9_9PROT|nr:hypothetical protein [Azospirillum doebereinerae]RUQ69339.1 hypothetical protein EJ913_16355 [Azospirillum doebereinerae]
MSRQRAALCLSFPSLTRAALLGALMAAPLALSAPAAAAPAKQPAAAAKPAKPAAAKTTAAKPGACYSRSEHAAEQLMRMHTEMMVVGLTCKSVVPEKNPFGLYQDFSVKNRAMLSSSEATLIGYYKKTGGNGTQKFDTFRTELANEVSRRAATIGIPQYCQTFVDRSIAAKELNADDLRILTSDEKNAGLMHLASKPLCDVQVVSVPDAPIAVAQASTGRAPAKATAAKAKAPAKAPAKAAAAKPKVVAAPAKQTVAAR